ncbi:hypothetical protein ACJ41O_006716 [Fusarium nematophilum]
MPPEENRIKLKSLLYAYYLHPDLEKADTFLKDFGLTPTKATPDKIWYRGFGEHPFCYVSERPKDGKANLLGGGWLVETHKDLEAASRLLNASPIVDHDGPGGGKVVTVKDPEGCALYLHFGLALRPKGQMEKPQELIYNTWDRKRREGDFQRFEEGPAKVYKLGHYGHEVNHDVYESVLQWYLDTFTLKVTDAIFSPETGKDIMNFVHIDKGEEFVDHHQKNWFLSAGKVDKGYLPHHSSFEVDDFDSELMGHNWLEKNGYSLVWGVGRHFLGSQIFDYWFDPDQMVVEHYADGDMVNSKTPVDRVAASPKATAIWGPSIPLAFFTRNPADQGKFLGGPPGGPGPQSQAV